MSATQTTEERIEWLENKVAELLQAVWKLQRQIGGDL